MAVIKVSDTKGVRYLKCFDTLDNVEYFEDEDETIVDDGELTVGTPLE